MKKSNLTTNPIKVQLYHYIISFLLLFVLTLSGCRLENDKASDDRNEMESVTENTNASAAESKEPTTDINDTQKEEEKASAEVSEINSTYSYLNAEGMSLSSRIYPPKGYSRIPSTMEEFTGFLRELNLKADGSEVLLYDGTAKQDQDNHVAVFDLEIGNRDLQQCADSVMRLYAEYYWSIDAYDKIAFHLTNGFLMEYTKWREGNRLVVDGNTVSWTKSADYNASYEVFRSYLNMVFAYAGTLSLSQEVTEIALGEIRPGDLFLQGGSPGHCVLVLDVAIDKDGKRCFLLGQGYMPAQDFHVLKNPLHEEDPWYYEGELDYPLETPSWTFGEGSLVRWSEFKLQQENSFTASIGDALSPMKDPEVITVISDNFNSNPARDIEALPAMSSGISVPVLSGEANTNPVTSDDSTRYPSGSEDANSSPNTSGTVPLTTSEVSSQVTLLAVGDNLIHTEVILSGKQADGTYQYDHLYSNLKQDISAADIAVINQETILGGKEFPYSGYPNFNSPQEIGDAIVAAGFDVVLHATNHTMDKQYEGVENTFTFWSKYPEITILGINQNKEEQERIPIIEKNGIKIAMLNYTYGLNGYRLPKEKPYLVNMLDKNRMTEDILKAKKQADFVIVFPHWGKEYVYEATTVQRELTDLFYELGVDLVIGTHPHVIEPVEWIIKNPNHRMLVYYSLGNFISYQREAPRMLGAMANITITKNENSTYISKAGITPLITHYENGPRDYHYGLYRLTDYTIEQAMAHGVSELAQQGPFTYEEIYALAKQVLGSWFY